MHGGEEGTRLGWTTSGRQGLSAARRPSTVVCQCRCGYGGGRGAVAVVVLEGVLDEAVEAAEGPDEV